VQAYYCRYCGHSSHDAFISLFNNEPFCTACGKKLEAKSADNQRKRGRPKMVNKKVIRSIRFDDDEWALIQEAAEKEGLNTSNFIRGNLRSIANDVLKKDN
jgi:hypothetical protein